MKLTHSEQVPWADALNQGSFHTRKKSLGGEKLSCSLWELPPGKKSFPLHRHFVTEEAMYVLSGRCTVRTDQGTHTVGPGDFVSFPAGGAAHQLINDSDAPCTFLAMSAGMGADVVEYPDTQKVAAAVGTYPTGKRYIFKTKDQVGYFDGEQ